MATEHEDDEHRINGQDEELRMLYQMSAGEIDSFKQRQWQITNYAALIYAALFVALQNIDIEGNSGYLLWGPLLVGFAVSLVVVFLCCRALENLESAIKVRRARMKHAEAAFSPVFKLAHDARKKEYNLSLLTVFYSVLYGGCFILYSFSFFMVCGSRYPACLG